MTSRRFSDVEFGEDLPPLTPDTSIPNVTTFVKAAGMLNERFTDHEAARKQGLPGAIVPGIMSQAVMASMIHHWAPEAQVEKIDTVFRAPVLVGHPHTVTGVVTDMDDDAHTVEIDLTLENEAGETRVLGTATVRLP
ncbi:MAG: hypothetical protein CL910_21235 [Deltaproteobacteria bacterium]|jgi:acyl dehydratase|nr:hypothetical protein [Deltaproteobacteria bacterium]